MKYVFRGVVLGVLGYIAGIWLTVAIRGGSPTDEVAVVFGFILGLIGWLGGVGCFEGKG